jgi:hypothetical protein
VIVDGKDFTPDSKQITIEVHGDIQSLKADCCETICVTGNVGSVSTQSGDIECGPVAGNVQTMSGDVECGDIGGQVSTMSGDITSSGHIQGGSKTLSGRVRSRE